MKARIYNPTDPDLPEVARKVLAIFTNTQMGEKPKTSGYEKYKQARRELKLRAEKRAAESRQARLGLEVEQKQTVKTINYAR